MPRVHGIETQRRRHGGGGTTATAGGTSFSLSTPFSNFAGRAPPSTTTGTSTSNNHTARMMEDDLSFHGTQPSQQQHQDEEGEEEVPGTQNPNFPTTRPISTIPTAVRGGDAMTAQQNKHNAGAPSSVAPPVVHHPSFLNRGRGGGTNNNNGSTIITKITPRDKRQLDGMEFGTSSFSVSNITPRERGSNTASVAVASSSGGATTSSSKVASSHTSNGVAYHDSRTSNRQYYQPATVMGGGRLEGASSSIAAPAAMYSHSTTTITSPTNTKTTSTKVNDGKLRATGGDESGLLNHGTSNNAVGVVATASTTTNEEAPAKANKYDTETAMLKSNQNDSDDKIKYKDGMDDDTDDSTSNTNDDDEEQSVDLLLNDDDDDDDNNNGGVSIPNNNVKRRSNNNGQQKQQHHRSSNSNNNNNNNASSSSSSSSSSLSLSPISPATQTLDRLSMIGTQDGGAELCVELNANAVRTPMREKDKAKSPPEKTAAAIAISTEATTTAVVSTKKDDRSKVGTPSFQSVAATGSRTSRTTTTTSTTPPDIMKGIEPGVDFLPGATMFAKYRGDRLSQAQMIKKRGKGDDVEYYIQYLGLEKTEEEEDDACCCWVSVKHLYEINPQTKRLFRQYGTTGADRKFGFNDSTDQQQGGEEEELESSTTPPLTKQQRCIRSLKEYFMSTQNSAQYAENKLNRSSGGMELPLVTFCHHCNNNHNNTSLSQLPHHGLCPKHEDFFVSGSYEILNLIVDGNLLGCNACVYHFENGRPNKQLIHLENCKRYKAKGSRVVVGKKGRKAEASSSFGSVGGGGMSLTQLSARNRAKKQDDFPSSNNRGDTADEAGNGQGDETEKQYSSSNNKNVGSRDNKDGKQESPELSDYEKLRLRNIQRNEARLAALGLLVPSNKKSANNNKKSNNKEGFLSRNDSNNDGESKKGRSKGRKKQQQQQPEAQKRTQPKRHKQKNGDDDQIQRRPALTEKENSSVSNQKQHHAHDVRKNNGDFAPAAKAKGKSIESASLVEAAKSGCRKCTLEWQTDTKDPTKSHDSCCPRGNSSRLSNTQQQQKPKGSKKSSSRTPPPQTSSMVQKKSSQVTPRLSPALQETRHTGAATTMANTSSSVSQGGQSMLMDVDSGLFQSALQKGFSAAYLRGKTEEEMLALLTSGRDSQQSLQPILPPFIRDFIDEADRNNEIPAPRGTKWLSCPNPWGKIGHEEGDFVVISPFQSESAADMVSVFHQGPNGSIPKRFVANPLEEGSPYHETHRSPARKGYSVLRLTRDRMGLRPWGFTVRLHEFGGACLVDSIEPLSPADAAEDISGWTDKDTPSGLQLHDMVICVNGKSVGCMTEAELQIDLDICGSEMMLVVARFDIEGNTNQNMTLEDLAMDWNDIGAVAPSRKKVVCFDDEESSEHRSELSRRPNFGMRNVSIQDCRPGSHDDDDDSNEEEIESDDDVADKTEDSLHRTHRLTSELESKSDEQLMEKLIEITGSRNWNKATDCPLAKLLAKRGCLAAAKDESVQRLSCDSGGVTKDQMIEWMSRSETFQQYKQIMRTKWSERHFSKHFIEALKDAGYTKISGGNKTRWSLPEDTVPRKVREQDVSSQEYQPDEEDSDNRKQGSRKVDNVVSEFESKTDEELMEMLREGIKSGECAQLARVLAQRACLAAAQDENIQELNNVSGGVTKAQILEWMDRSEVFKGYKKMVRTQTKEEAFMKRLTEALTSLGYVRFGTGPNTRWALPKDIVPRVDVDAKQSAASELFDSKTDEELMEMLLEGIKSGEWIQLARVLAQRACLAAAQDENIQELNNVSGGVTKAQIINWINGSKTFQRYEQMVRTKWSETSFQNKIGDALRSAGYVRFGGGINTRYELPEDTEPRVDIGVRPNNSKRKLIKSVGSTAGKRKRESDTFAQHKKQFHQYSDESSHSSSEDEEDDDNPWLGCVCGRTHPAPIQVFWIQCGACDAWHNVAEDCVGFSEEAADTLDEWFCWSCNPPCPGMDL